MAPSMDTAAADAEGAPERPGAARPPSIGVRSIPARPAPARPPRSVPSVPLPDPAAAAALAPDAAPPPARPASPGSPATGSSDTAPDDRAVTGPADQAVDGPGAVGPFDMAFPPGVAAKLGWYVYLLVEPDSGRPFFVGRGRGDRCFDHVRAARVGPSSTGQDRRAKKFPALDQIRRIEKDRSRPVGVEILRYGMSADEARLVAAATADVLGLASSPDGEGRSRRQAAAELGIRLAKGAKFKRDHPVVLLQVAPQVADTDYRTVRHGWRIGRRWTDPGAARSPRWAVIVAGPLVVGVYRIDGWEPTPVHGRPGRPDPGPPDRPDRRAGAEPGATVRSTYRHSFIGERDEQMEDRYLGRSVAAYLGPRARSTAGPGTGLGTGAGAGAPAGAPNQVVFVGCGPNALPPAH